MDNGVEITLAKRWLDIRQASEYTSLSAWLIRRAIKGRKLCCSRHGKKIICDIQDIDQWMQSQKS